MTAFTALLYLLIISLPLGQLGRISLYPGVNFYAHDLIVTALITIGAFSLNRKKFSTSLPIFRPIIAFFSVGLVSLAINFGSHQSRELIIGSLYLWRWIAYATVFIFVSQDHLIKPGTRKIIPQLLIVSGLIAAVVGLLQYLFIPDTRFLFALGWDKHYYRLIGTWLDPGFTGAMLVLTQILILNRYWLHIKSLKKLNRYHLLLVFTFITTMLTYSRSSFIALFIGYSAVAYFKQERRIFIIGFAAIVLTTILLPRPGGEGVKLERVRSITARLISNQYVIRIIQDKPVMGVGFNLLRYERASRGFAGSDWEKSHAAAGADNSFLFILATTGVVGLIFYTWVLASQIKFAYSRRNLAFISSLLAMIVHAQFNNTLFYPWVMLWLWLLLASKTTRSN